MTPEEFTKQLYESVEEDYYGIFPPPTEAQHGLDILIKHFLGKDYYTISTTNGQANSEAIYEILKRYPMRKEKRYTLLEYIKSITQK